MDKLEETFKDLSPESIALIKEAVDNKVKEKVSLHVDQALNEQDEMYSNKLEQLLTTIDKDHTLKLEKVIKAYDADKTKKLKMVIEKYENVINNDAKEFKQQLIESISEYLEVYLNEVVPTADIQEAVKNKKAIVVLENLRNHLAVDAALQRESVKEAVMDGKKQINEASSKLESVLLENADLKNQLNKLKTETLIESKSSTLDDQQKKYIKKVLADKTPEFIEENFDYTLKLFKKKSENRLESLKEEALNESSKADRVIFESNEEQPAQVSPYLQELRKY